MRIQWITAVFGVALLSGCGGSGDGDSTDTTQTDNAPTDANIDNADATNTTPTGDNATTADSSVTQDDVVRVPVKPGHPDYTPPKREDAIKRIILAPVDVYRSAIGRIDKLQVKRQADLDELQNGPFKDADDYIKRVLKPLQIQVPDLPAGQKYVYDKETKQLMIEKPAGS